MREDRTELIVGDLPHERAAAAQRRHAGDGIARRPARNLAPRPHAIVQRIRILGREDQLHRALGDADLFDEAVPPGEARTSTMGLPMATTSWTGAVTFFLRRKVFARLVDTPTSRNCVDLGRTPGALHARDARCLSSLGPPARRQADPPPFLKSMLLTLAIFAALGSALWSGPLRSSGIISRGNETTAAAASAVALLIGLLGGWLLFRAIAVAVIGVFADEVVPRSKRNTTPHVSPPPATSASRARSYGHTVCGPRAAGQSRARAPLSSSCSSPGAALRSPSSSSIAGCSDAIWATWSRSDICRRRSCPLARRDAAIAVHAGCSRHRVVFRAVRQFRRARPRRGDGNAPVPPEDRPLK
ncbi:hypothetical protein DdX_20461 [Ditylenchus destructor]|uniref:Uncharacterized protein n=1 Tax=Ditylenchus destructor TaxID=166010 RepID=A0AAD4MKS1_9BILA|nr:hypothetical protein DdX_20461 [Ditylenchus destructor]